MAAPRRKQQTCTILAIDESLDGAAQAASLTLGILTHTKTVTWADLTAAVQAQDTRCLDAMRSLFLTAAQEAVLAAHPGVVHTVRRKDGDLPRVTVAVCGACQEWVAVTSTAPSSCQMTDGCTGKYVKPRDASRVTIPLSEVPRRDVPVASLASPAQAEPAAPDDAAPGAAVVEDDLVDWDAPDTALVTPAVSPPLKRPAGHVDTLDDLAQDVAQSRALADDGAPARRAAKGTAIREPDAFRDWDEPDDIDYTVDFASDFADPSCA